jgi:hypothetical protein
MSCVKACFAFLKEGLLNTEQQFNIVYFCENLGSR